VAGLEATALMESSCSCWREGEPGETGRSGRHACRRPVGKRPAGPRRESQGSCRPELACR